MTVIIIINNIEGGSMILARSTKIYVIIFKYYKKSSKIRIF